MIQAFTFYPHERVFTDSPVELLGLFGLLVTLVTVLVSAVTYYRSTRCHNSSCRNRLGLRRHGRFPHGHFRLCHVHHPHVSSDGTVLVRDVEDVTKGTPGRSILEEPGGRRRLP